MPEDSSLGVTLLGDGRARFTVYSAHATEVSLCLFADPKSSGLLRDPVLLRPSADGLWSAVVDGIRPGQLYGYRADGPWKPTMGHRFNPSKLLIDPMAHAITEEPQPHPSTYGFTYRPDPARPPASPSEPVPAAAPPDLGLPSELGYNSEDSAPFLPKCVVVDPTFDWQDDRPPRTPWRETVIYECHVRGMTMRHPKVDPALRGTYLGMIAPPVLDHLSSLGVTAVELMPVQHMASEFHLLRRQQRNYWGYSPVGFCAPFSGYASGGLGQQVTEFKTMVRELHRAGLEVILDVVFNHTAEGDHLGPVLSLKGLDNATYYRLPRSGKAYKNYSGCGNTLDMDRPAVRRLVLESLRRWVIEMHVDGFRFDLAPILGRVGHSLGGDDGFDAEAPLFAEIAADPVLRDVKLIAEPWDAGGEYRLGQFPADWAEWNDRYRDAVRAFWRGDRGTAAGLAQAVAGSSDLFGNKGPLDSVNFVTCHDGFTLQDLVSYDTKHNQANGENNQDGHGNNLSRNWGEEGPTKNAEIRSQRDRSRRNLFATLALSQGVPMVLHGDEIGRTQHGNNNAYCQDNKLSWVEWGSGDPPFLAFVRQVLEIRRRYPELRRERFLESNELMWWHPSGRHLSTEDWENPDTRALAVVVLAVEEGRGEDLLLLLNGSEEQVRFLLPESGPHSGWSSRRWTELLDTAHAESFEHSPTGQPTLQLMPFSMRAFAVA